VSSAVRPAEPPVRRVGLVARLLLKGIDLYQLATGWRGSPCRFVPSCSLYGAEAIEVHGAVRGTVLTVRRLARCQPWGPSGADPVPQRKV